MSVINITKRNLTLEIKAIDEKASYIAKLKDEAIQALLEQKKSILTGPCKNVSKLPAKIEIEYLKDQHDSVMGKYMEKRDIVHEEKEEYDVMGEDFDEIDVELRGIEERHHEVMEQLESKRAFLVQRLDSINHLEKEVNTLETELLQVKSGLKSELSNLEMQKNAVLQGNSDMSLEEIEASVQLAMEKFGQEINKITGKIEDINNIDYIKRKFGRNSEQIAEVEEALCLAATSADRRLLEARLKTLSMQQKEWDRLLALTEMSAKDRFSKLLEDRGMFYTASGRIRTMSGRILSLGKAVEAGLLDGLNDEMSDLFGITVTESRRICTASGEVISCSEAAKRGFLKTAQSSEGSVSSTSSDTTVSQMSSADVNYLKINLGKVLTLALAEITAKQPRDPIHYLGHWLFKYRYNQERDVTQKMELEALIVERERLARLRLRKEAEEEANNTLIDLLGRVDSEAARREIEAELRRIEAEALAREEEEDLEGEARDTLGVYNGPPVNN